MSSVFMSTKKNSKGSLTIEAAIALPLFTCFILSLILIIRIFGTHGIIQHALNQAAQEMAEYSYVYSKSTNSEAVFGDLAVKMIVEKNLSNNGSDADHVLKKLGVKNGLSGFDLSLTKILENKRDIEIVASYQISGILPVKIIPDLFIVQRSTARAWLDPVESSASESDITGVNIWELDPLSRGKAVQEKFGRNLPWGYPLLTIFNRQTGEASVVKSIDLTSATYMKKENLETRLNAIIHELKSFNGAIYAGASVKSYEILKKRVVIVVPEASVKPEMSVIFDQRKSYAAHSGIILEVVEYEKKLDKKE